MLIHKITFPSVTNILPTDFSKISGKTERLPSFVSTAWDGVSFSLFVKGYKVLQGTWKTFSAILYPVSWLRTGSWHIMFVPYSATWWFTVWNILKQK